MQKYFGSVFKAKRNEIIVDDSDTINSPFFRNNTGYKVELEDKKIKKLVAHYYYNA